MFRILLAHNFYGSAAPSGENHVFEAEAALLRQRGHTVEVFLRHSDVLRSNGALGALVGAFCTPWNPFSAKAIRREVEAGSANVVHVHNTFPLISPSIFHAVGNRAARVLTLHNYRLFCPAAIPMRAGNVCTECLDRHSVLPAMRYGCYRGGRLTTLPLAANVALHRYLGTWTRHVDAFIALSEFQRERMIEAGLPADLVHVKPNFFPGKPFVVPWERRQPYVIFAGRLSPEKGVTTLLGAWKAWGLDAPELRLVGDGELRSKLEHMARGLPVRFLGQMNSVEAQKQIAGARLLILPSEWFEGFPMVVPEAFAFGTPAGVSDIGPLPSIVQHGVSGVVFTPSNPESLLREVRAAWESPNVLEQFGRRARAEFETKYTENANYAMLMEIYERAVAVSKNRSDPGQ